MKQGHRTLKDRMLERLITATGWMSGASLAQGLSSNTLAIEDALSDLVIEESAQFKAESGYRLNASVLCRMAVRELRSKNLRRFVKAMPFEGSYRVGVAEYLPDAGLVVYEIDLREKGDSLERLDEHIAQALAILNFSKRELTHG